MYELEDDDFEIFDMLSEFEDSGYQVELQFEEVDTQPF
jgi:hypothetical protein